MDAKFGQMVAFVKLVASTTDSFGYITYVFQRLEDYDIYTKYIMCVRFPNWDAKLLELGDIGFLQYEEIRAGVDKWFNGTEMVPYNYNTVQFIKFVYKPVKEDYEYIMLIKL